LFGKKKEIIETETETEKELVNLINKLKVLYDKNAITTGEYMQIGLLIKLVSMVEKALS